MKSIKTHHNAFYLFGIAAFLTLVSACGKSGASGELVGVGIKNFRSNEVPYGMVYIPGGSFIMGQTDQDVTFGQLAQNKEVTVAPFFMDETEITNSEYRQFVNWVRDSTIIEQLSDATLKDKFYISDKNAKGQAPGTPNNNSQRRRIDWRKVGPNGVNLWKAGSKKSLKEWVGTGLTVNFLGEEKLNDRKFTYEFSIFDVEKAAAERNDRNKDNIQQSDISKQVFSDRVGVYPDTLVWKAHLFKRSHNEPMVLGYFRHPAYNNYPVVGISWRQARAFSVWRGKLNDSYRSSKKLPKRMPYSLPTEAEFEYAARGGRVGTTYPWGGPYARNAKGCLMANFKPARGRYADDGATFTVNVKSYFPNDFGLYNIAGNVAEWTNDAYNVSAYNISNTLNPVINNASEKRKVVRGGSWNDIGFFLQNSSRTYEMQDEQTAFIGFRCVTPYIGRDIKDK